jgi:hypothetical protein
MRTLLVAIALAALRSRASADGALEELSAGNVPQTATSPRSSWIGDKLAGIWEPSEAFQVRLDLTGTRTSESQASASDILLVNLGVEYDPSTHWTLKLMAGGSPSSTSFTTSNVEIHTGTSVIQGDTRVQADASSMNAGAWAGYDTDGDSNFETSALLSVNGTHFDTLPQLASVRSKSGQMVTPQQVIDSCATNTCSPALVAALAAQSTTLDQLVIDGTLTEQLYKNTDVGLDGAYYLYDKDPATAGYSTTVGLGRSTIGGGVIGIAPFQYTAAPSVIHRWGPLMALTSFSYGKYVDELGYNLTPSLRLQYKFKLDDDRRLKVWIKASGSRDVDQMGAASKSGSLATGLQYTW